MTKPLYQMWFVDRAGTKSTDPRGDIARMLRAYRRDKNKYELKRVSTGKYFVSLRGTNVGAYIERIA
jgi:hypothetical protein